MSKPYDYLIVGCGFTGVTLAQRIAEELDGTVLIVERRNHVGGNAYDYYDDQGILVSKYGAHIFHTASERVWRYITRFAEFSSYVHYVDAFWQGAYYALPLNLNTINSFFGKNMKSEELPSFLNSIRVQIPQPANAEEAVLSKIGVELYDAFYRNYTRKQWGMDPKDLDASVTMRLPIRMNDDRRYFTDPWQGIPKGGYTTLFDQMLRHKNIHLALNTDFKAVRNSVKYRKLIFTGPIDEYFDCVYGKLPYRSIEFRFEKLSQKYYQHMAVVNYPNEHEFTRCVEYKWLNGQHHDKTTISRDFPCWNDNEPYYPVPSIANKALFLKYKELADRTPNIFFCGRLGAYTYYNMDECVGQALDLFDKEIKNDGK